MATVAKINKRCQIKSALSPSGGARINDFYDFYHTRVYERGKWANIWPLVMAEIYFCRGHTYKVDLGAR